MENEISAMLDHTEMETPAFVMSTAAEALDLLAQYNHDFVREIDKDEVASVCRIISEYLQTNADKLSEE